MDFIEPGVVRYAEEHTTPHEPDLQKVFSATQRHPMARMLSGPVVANLLAILVPATGARRVLEVGTFTGYSALAMAQHLPQDGEVVTLEADEETAVLARGHFEKHPHGSKVRLLVGDAHDTLAELQGPFDIAFLDADKTGYPEYWDPLVSLVRPGGLIVVDNTLWSGRVVAHASDDPESGAIDRLNRMVRDDHRVRAVLLTVRDGLTIALRLNDTESLQS